MVPDKFPRWRKPKLTDRTEHWTDAMSAPRLPPRSLTPEQEAHVEAIVAAVREVRLPGLVLRMSAHRKVYARACVLRHLLDEGPTALGLRLGLPTVTAWRAARGGLAILREYFGRDELRELLTGPPSSEPWGPGPAAGPAAAASSPGTWPPSPAGGGPAPAPAPSRPAR